MDFQRAWAALLRDMVRQAQCEADRAIREGFTEPLERWLNDLLSRGLPHDWQRQLQAKLQTLADDGFTLAPHSVKTLEQWILAQAERRALLPNAEDDLALPMIHSHQPDFWKTTSDTLSDAAYVGTQTLKGVAQGAANSLNGLQDVAVGIANLPAMAWNWSIGWIAGNQVTYWEVGDWSENLFIQGDAWHKAGKFAGGEGLATVVTAGVGHIAKLRYIRAAEKAAAAETAAVEAEVISEAAENLLRRGISGKRFRTWNQFQAGTKGQFGSRTQTAEAWNVYKNANKIVIRSRRSSRIRKKYLRSLIDDYRTPAWQKNWLKQGKVPPGYEVDHIKPLSIGGSDLPINMRLQGEDLHQIHHIYFRG